MGIARAVTIILSVVLVTIAGAIPLIPAAVVKIALPAGGARRAAGRVVYWVSSTWAKATHTLIRRISGTRVIVAQEMADDPDGRYVLIANHQSWADIMLLIAAIYPQLPFPRFFIKEPLRWLPVIGLACWALDFPFMKRHSRAALAANPQLRRDDMDTIQRVCAVFRDVPVSIVNYAEGTRSTPDKRALANSPYDTLLPPKAGGTAFAVNAMADVLDGILDVTMAYVNTPEPAFWDLLCGRIPEVVVRIRYISVPPELARGDYTADDAYRDQFKAWLGELWTEKDRAVAALQDPNHSATRFADLGAHSANGD